MAGAIMSDRVAERPRLGRHPQSSFRRTAIYPPSFYSSSS